MHEKTTAVQIVMPQHCNGYKNPRLFGGQIMAWIDVVGAVAARRYTRHGVTTVCIDHLNFLKPAYMNDTIEYFQQNPIQIKSALAIRLHLAYQGMYL